MSKSNISYLYFIIILKFVSSCECNKHHVHGNGNISKTNQTEVYIAKSLLEFEDYSTTEFIVDNMSEISTPYESTVIVTPNEITVDVIESSTDLNKNTEGNMGKSEASEVVMEGIETNVELNESTISSENETTTEGNEKRTSDQINSVNRQLKKKCLQYKKGISFDLRKMADVWQVVYYRLPNKLKCFKLLIKLVKKKDQKHYSKVYGSFNNTVHWNKISLEIKSSDKSRDVTRKHFLQGTENEKGVVDNIIIDEEHGQNTTHLTLYRETPDQWLVLKNILMMRDCENGDLVVFTRVPSEPRRDVILDALSVFGENKTNGTMACVDKGDDKSWLKYDDSHAAQPLL